MRIGYGICAGWISLPFRMWNVKIIYLGRANVIKICFNHNVNLCKLVRVNRSYFNTEVCSPEYIVYFVSIYCIIYTPCHEQKHVCINYCKAISVPCSHCWKKPVIDGAWCVWDPCHTTETLLSRTEVIEEIIAYITWYHTGSPQVSDQCLKNLIINNPCLSGVYSELYRRVSHFKELQQSKIFKIYGFEI